ncbi:MAG TPA: LysR substrate-binding domain-containing protein [Verrucomicrobiae bacterium]|nr:LysR substrate-binding domain-containing protein [Verrucomicrobiae bacterium]
MELRHLRYFVAVAEKLNFTKAASQLRVAQPALSRQIRDLEDELGASLLDRGPRQVKLTEAGKIFLPEAKAVLERADLAIKAVRMARENGRTQIHIGYAPSPTVELLPCALHAFQGMAPNVRVMLHDLSSEEMLRGLYDSKLDLCLMVRVSAKALRGLKFELLREYPVCVAFSPNHPLAKKKEITLKQIVNEPLLAYTRADYPEYHTMVEALFKPLGVQPNIVEEYDSAPGLVAATEVGRGIAIVPSVMSFLTGGRVKLRPIIPAPPALHVGAVYNPKNFPASVQKFLQAAHEEKPL